MTAPTSARWDLLSTGSVTADARSRTIAVNVETVHADDGPELIDAIGQALRFLEVDGAWEEPQDVRLDGFAQMGRS